MRNRNNWKRRVALVACCGTIGAVLAGGIAGAGTVSGPVTGGSGFPANRWTATDLAAQGYAEREYFLDGTATAYGMATTWTSDGRWPAIETTQASFRTRMIVRHPINPRRFNGTVVVEWLNVSAGFDVDPVFIQANEELLRAGYAYVAVSAQRVGLEAVKAGDPARYSSLVHPGDSYSYDMFTQAGRAVVDDAALLLPGLDVERVLATGESQSASRMVTYINAVHPRERVFDGFLVYSRGSGASSIFDGATMPQYSLIRTDAREPIIDIQTEGDIVVLRSHLAHQPDTARFRLWELAGGAHADEYTLSHPSPPTPSSPGAPCTNRLNSMRTHMLVNAGFRALHRWVAYGLAPINAPRITLGSDANATDPVVRDWLGNALGGIRFPQLEAPVARIDGIANPAPPGAPPLFQSFCRLFGRTFAFPDAALDLIYPTHDGYVDAVAMAARRAVRRGFLLPVDGIRVVSEAAAAPVGGDL